MKIAPRWTGCLPPLRFLTVSAVNAQTYLNCYRFSASVLSAFYEDMPEPVAFLSLPSSNKWERHKAFLMAFCPIYPTYPFLRTVCLPISEFCRRMIQPARPLYQIPDIFRCQQAAVRTGQINPQVLRRLDNSLSPKLLCLFRLLFHPDLGKSCHSADCCHALF